VVKQRKRSGNEEGPGPKDRGIPWADIAWRLEDFSQRLMKGGQTRLVGGGLVALTVIWLLSGIYVVGPGEVGVERQFGKFVTQTDPGLNYRLPWPIQAHDVVNMETIRRAEIGFRTVKTEEIGMPAVHERVPEESLMLTRDKNIADIQVLVQYRVKNATQFLFRVKDPELALHFATEVALRGVIGNTPIDYAMLEGRPEVEADTWDSLQTLLDDYETGLHVVEVRLLAVDPPEEVKDAFHEVVRAWEDKDRLIQEARGYALDVVPKARGDAEKETKAAEAYRDERILRAEGDTDRFLKILDEYQKAKTVTRERLYLEMVESVLAGTEKFVIDPKAGGGNLLQHLVLNHGNVSVVSDK